MNDTISSATLRHVALSLAHVVFLGSALFVLLALATAPAQAAPGDLDSAFGDAGKKITDFGAADGGEATAVQDDGKIVVVGGSWTGWTNSGWDVALARYNADGSLDTSIDTTPASSFSHDGKETADFGANEYAYDVALQPVEGTDEEKVLVAGYTERDGHYRFLLARYNADGTLDSSFGEGGKVTTAFGPWDSGQALAVQHDGKIVAVGGSGIVRYRDNGTLDETFSDDGRVATSSSNSGVALQPDGKIVVVGSKVERYNANGSLDQTFANLPWGDDGGAVDVAIQGNGEIVVAGGSYSSVVLESYGIVRRYNADGTPIGWGSIVGAGMQLYAMALQPDGKILTVGDGVLARQNVDGSPDPSFGSYGIQQVDFNQDLAVQDDGKIILAGGVGGTGDASSGDFAVARHLGDDPDTTAPDTTINEGPSAATSDKTPTFAFSSSEEGSTFECRVDGEEFGSCTSPHRVSSLSDGRHAFEVRAIDRAGNVDASPAQRTFTVDTVAPETTITSGPTGDTRDRTATFRFESSEAGSRFECRVDDGGFSACDSPHSTSSLSEGSHTFEVRAYDTADNIDASAASWSWRIVPDYRREVLATPGLVSYWRRGETSGTTATDAKGANTGGYRNGMLLGRPGALLHDTDTSARLDGADDYLTIADHSSLDTGDSFTLEAWVKRSSTSSATKTLVSKGSGGYRLSFVNDVLTLSHGGSGTIARASVSTTDTASFHHVVATKSGSTVRLYIDGENRTGGVTNRTVTNTSTALNIGRYTSGTEHFPGTLDEVAVYGDALSATQVRDHFRASGR